MAVLPIKVEADLGGWTDITSYVLGTGSDVGGQVEIFRGRPNETQLAEQSHADLSLKNPDGRFCPRLPTGPYYGLLGRNTPLRVSYAETVDTAPQFDAAASFSSTSTINMAWDHTPVGDVKGVLVFVVQNVGTTDEVTGVTYGGVAMTEVAGSPLAHTTGAEDGALYAYHLGSGIPQGLQAVVVSVNGTASSKDGYSITVTADSTTTVVEDTTTLDSGGVANPSVTLTTAVKTFIAAALHSGQDDPASITATLPAVSIQAGTDFGTQTADGFYRADAPSGSPTIGATAASEEAALFGIALKNGPNIARFYGEVPAWPVDWDTTGTFVWTSIEAAGVTRRLGQGAKPLRSALARWVPMRASVRAYWPMEDEGQSTRFASGLPSGSPMLVSSTGLEYAVTTGPPGSAPLPNWQINGSAFGSPPPVSAPWRVDWVFFMPTAPASGGREMISIFSTSDTAARWTMNCSATDLTVDLENDSGTSVHNSAFGSIPSGFYGTWHRCFISVRQSGSNVAYIAKIISMDGTEEATWANTVSGTRTTGKPQRAGLYITTTDERSIGHVTVGIDDTGASLDPFGETYHGFTGETATARIIRLCTDESLTYRIVGTTDDVKTMGPQSIATLLDLLRECEAADGGVLYEPREFLGVAYRTRESLYNQDARLSLPYGSGLGTTPAPVDDDALIRNDVTATRTGGSSARVVETTGPLSTQAPPDGVGTYDQAVEVNVETDNMIDDQASWRVHLGTVDEYRFPVVHLGLSNAYWAANPSQQLDAVQLDIGDRFDITDPPVWLPPDDIAQLVQGSVETLTNFTRDIRLNASPESPWRVMIWDTFHFDTSGSELQTGIDDNDLSMSITTTDGPIWTTAGAEFPFDVLMGGERMTISAISGGSSPQTFTISARSVNGVVKSHSAGESLTLADRPIWAL